MQAKHDGEIVLDPQSRTMIFYENSQPLTRIEFRLLENLLSKEGSLVSRQELLDVVWGAQVSVGARTVDSHIVRVRRKLEILAPRLFCIETVWGLGYRFRSVQEK